MIEHIRSIEASGAEAVVVKSVNDLAEVDGLILPGGESTAMRKLIDRNGCLLPCKHLQQKESQCLGHVQA